MTTRAEQHQTELNQLINEYNLTSCKTYTKTNFNTWLKDNNITNAESVKKKFNQLIKENKPSLN